MVKMNYESFSPESPWSNGGGSPILNTEQDGVHRTILHMIFIWSRCLYCAIIVNLLSISPQLSSIPGLEDVKVESISQNQAGETNGPAVNQSLENGSVPAVVSAPPTGVHTCLDAICFGSDSYRDFGEF